MYRAETNYYSYYDINGLETSALPYLHKVYVLCTLHLLLVFSAPITITIETDTPTPTPTHHLHFSSGPGPPLVVYIVIVYLVR